MNTSLILILSIFFIIFFAIKPFQIKKFSLNMVTSSLLVLFILFILGIVDIASLQNGIIGDENLSPWKILIIFFSVAYISVSTDITGIFDVIALRIVKTAGGDTKKLFFFFYIFASILTIFTSNDIVILTLTPIIFYLGKHAKLNILPFLFAEFFGANTLSMMLLIGNPTNIIISDALNIGFFEYFKVMFLPTIVATITNYALLFYIFKKDLQQKFTLRKDSKVHIKSYIDVGISAILMVLMLYTLTLSERLDTEIWFITLIFGVIFLAGDILFFLIRKRRNHFRIRQDLSEVTFSNSDLTLAIKRMPWSIGPFIFTFFVIVGILSNTPLFSSLVSGLSNNISNEFSAIFSMGFSSLITANIINNQPMSILFSNILLSPDFLVSAEALRGSIYATIIGSNLGANLTLIGALAGLIWKEILVKKGFNISYLDFLKKGIIITPITATITFIVLWGVLKVL